MNLTSQPVGLQVVRYTLLLFAPLYSWYPCVLLPHQNRSRLQVSQWTVFVEPDRVTAASDSHSHQEWDWC